MKVTVSISPDLRTISPMKRLYVSLTWVEGIVLRKQKTRKISTNIQILFPDWNAIKQNKTIREEIKHLRDRIQAIRDFGERLDLPDPEDNIAAMRAFLEHPEPIKEVPVERLRDFIRKFILLHEKTYSRNRIQHYRILIRNIELFLEQSGKTDWFRMLSQDGQMTWFSDYRDFLLHTEIEGIKRKYENSSAIHELNMISKVCSTFFQTGVKVNPNIFVEGLRVVKPDALYLTIDELRMVIDAWPKSESSEYKAVSLFLFQAMTGLRFSELKFKEDSIKGNILTITSGKKGVVNQVPLGNLACRIINSWSNRRFIQPHPHTNPQIVYEWCLPIINLNGANKHLHEFLKKIPGFDRPVNRVRYRGSERLEQSDPLWKAVSTHTGRHTYSHILTSSGLAIDEVGHLLSHGSIETTNKHYKHLKVDAIHLKALEVINTI